LGTNSLGVDSPAFYVLWLGHSYRGLAQYEAAISAYKKSLNRQPDYLFAHVLLAATYGLAGQETGARAEAAAVLKIDPEFSAENFVKRLKFYKDQRLKDRTLEGLRKAGLK